LFLANFRVFAVCSDFGKAHFGEKEQAVAKDENYQKTAILS
jgi:hypothetical protein